MRGEGGASAARLVTVGWYGLISVKIVQSYCSEDSWERSVVCIRRGDFLPVVVHGWGVDGGDDRWPALVACVFYAGKLFLLAVWPPIGGPQIVDRPR